jgi:hypothetical protein
MNSSHFVIERSTDGNRFDETGSVAARGNGNNNYSFTNILINPGFTYYYRLKMVDIDGKQQYSNIVRINNNDQPVSLAVFPNPSSAFITLVSNKKQELSIINSTGQPVKSMELINGSQTVNIGSWVPGTYFIRTCDAVLKFVKN